MLGNWLSFDRLSFESELEGTSLRVEDRTGISWLEREEGANPAYLNFREQRAVYLKEGRKDKI